ncbi:ankyrin repeat and MYND domain-containing protein 1 isoform X2 [Acanthopagrus latus]|uniref:ankyrin repeat and MYND domain-containing protein 1 isoform X2 n=1 Tax=Acanthopagrus latus TaxID=8177 RepID=UPI00187BD570|nr:ankyrin repeat and MYND domain-containing protein 1 isoform X2 [Acanthopagrus latus]
MLLNCKGAAADPGRGGAVPGAQAQSNGHGRTQSGEERRQGLGVQEWPDGARYEGEFVNGFKHGEGKYTWPNGEYYEGSFYKDYRHGDGLYCWPTGHKFTGKFYLNRKEGYGQQLFPDGSSFQGLYHTDQRFGPGVLSYPDGREDVGLWLGESLLKLCASVEEGFSLRNLPEYAAYMDPSATTDSLKKVDLDRELLSDENFVLPHGIESYSTDGDHLPLPPGRRRELDQHFYGELWEPDIYPHQGYERDPLSKLPLQARMQAHIHKHRLQAENVGWDVAAVLSLNRERFGPKGPLEVSSELLIQHASQGELQAVSQILQTGLVHPDVADSQGHTALIAATVNCQNYVIQLLLDMGANIDKLNCEGMSALAVCHVLYYPFQSLHTILAEPPAKTQVLSHQIRQVEFTTDTLGFNNRPQTADRTLSSRTNQSLLSDGTAAELTDDILTHSSKVSTDSELVAECWPALNDPEHLQEEREEKEEEGGKIDYRETEGEEQVRERESKREDEKESKGEESDIESRCDQMSRNEVKGKGRNCRNSKKKEADIERSKTESRNENIEESEEDVQNRVRSIHEDEDIKEREERRSEGGPGVERSIQVMDGHIPVGSVQWKGHRAKAAGRAQGKDREVTPQPTFDSARSVSSYNIQVTEEEMQHSAEALSRTGIPQCSDTQETVRKMAAMKVEHRIRLKTLKLLLERGADPNVSRVPMPVLFLATMAADAEAVKRLLLCGAHTSIPLSAERKGLYPLHVAAALQGPAGPRITELLLHAITDPDAQACDHNEIYEQDKIFMKARKPLTANKSSALKEGGRTALHVACQRESDYQNASKVVALLLSHRASTDLLWSGHSPLSLAIASGNDLAVEELLKGGANPSIPLGRNVGSALCALANINYHLGGNRAKLLVMLAKAGADILMPVNVGNVEGTAVDYAHHSFNQDVHIANTPFHGLKMRERETLKARCQLLTMMGDLLRKAAGKRERENTEREQQCAASSNAALPCESLPPITEKHRKPLFKFCYHCGRSVSVVLTPCSRCHKVYYCSRSCKLKAWDKLHKDECVLVSASAKGIQKNVMYKSQRRPRPLTVMVDSKTVSQPLSVKFKSQRVPKPMSMAEKVLGSKINPNENYSCN